MPVRFLKEGKSQAQKASDDAKVKTIVEGVLSDIESRGEAAVREYSQKFDNWNPESYRLTEPQIEECFAQLTKLVRRRSQTPGLWKSRNRPPRRTDRNPDCFR